MHLPESEVKRLSKFFTTLWNMTKLYGEPENKESYWTELHSKSMEIDKLYNDDPVVIELMKGLHNGLQRKMMGEEKWAEYQKRRREDFFEGA